VTVVAALIVIAAVLLPSAASLDVWTLKFAVVYVAAAGLVTPAIPIVPAALLARVQPAGSVTVTMLLDVDPVAPAAQPAKLPPKVTAGAAGRPLAQPASKVTATVSPAASEPVPVAVKCAVHVDCAPAFARLPVKVTSVGVVAAEMTTLDAGFWGAMSAVVCTDNVVAAYVAAAGFVIPAIAIVPAALFARVQPAGRVTVTTPLAAVAAVELQPAKLPPNVTVGDAGMPVHVFGNVIVTVSPAVRAPDADAVKPAVHVDDASAFVRDPAKVTELGPIVLSATVCAIQACDELSVAVDAPVVPMLAWSDGAIAAAESDSFETGFAFEAADQSFVVAAPAYVDVDMVTPASVE